jgi:hypothetical protein
MLWAMGDVAMAMVTCTKEESRESEMLDIHPLAVIGEKGSLIWCLQIGWWRG